MQAKKATFFMSPQKLAIFLYGNKSEHLNKRSELDSKF